MDNILELASVSKVFNGGKSNEVRVFENLNIAIAAGEVVGLIAPSGSGKSTLLNIAGLLDNPTSGEVRIGGVDLSKADDGLRTQTRREHIGFVYQFHHLLAEFTALENVMIPALNANVPRPDAETRAKELLEGIGLKDRMLHRPTALSGGEQQRVAICRALMNRPKLLLADEPTGNLDAENSKRVFDLFIALARSENQAALVATHNLELAERMDRVIDLRLL